VVRRLLTDSVRHAESPRWHEDRLWFSDVHDYRVKTVDLDGRLDIVVEAEGRPSGLGRHPDGRWLLVTALDRRLSWIEDGRLVPACDLAPLALGLTSDMVVDGLGRAYVSDTGFDHGAGEPHRLGRVILFDEDSGPRVVAEGIDYANGSAISPDGRTFYLAESFGNRLSAFDIADDGSLSNHRVLADFGTLTDGICLDADGCVWVALPVAEDFVRVDAGGRVLERVPSADGRMAIAPMLGGPEGRTLFLCSVRSTPENLSRGICDGVIEALEVETPRAGYP
jgi:sugar lactone lactonase YvrE